MFSEIKRFALSKKTRIIFLGVAVFASLLIVAIIGYYDSLSVPTKEIAFFICPEFFIRSEPTVDFKGHYHSSDTGAFIFSYYADPEIDDFEAEIVRSATENGWIFVEEEEDVLLFHQANTKGIVSVAVKVALPSDNNRILVGYTPSGGENPTSWERNVFWPRFDSILDKLRSS